MFTHKYGVAVRWVVATSAGIPVYSDKRRSKKLGVLAEGAHFHEVQRIGSWIRFWAEVFCRDGTRTFCGTTEQIDID